MTRLSPAQMVATLLPNLNVPIEEAIPSRRGPIWAFSMPNPETPYGILHLLDPNNPVKDLNGAALSLHEIAHCGRCQMGVPYYYPQDCITDEEQYEEEKKTNGFALLYAHILGFSEEEMQQVKEIFTKNLKTYEP